MPIDKNDKLSEVNNTLNESEEPYYNSVYQPWQIKEQLTPWLEVKKENTTPYAPSWFQDNDTTWVSAYSWWNFTITTWFRPSRIDIKATRPPSNEWASTWTAIIDADWNIENWCIYLDWSFTNVWKTDWSAIWLIKQATSFTTLSVTAVSDTGFTLNVSNNNWRFDTIITAQA